MPVRQCSDDGKPGYKWGDSGKCYTYPRGNETARKAAKRRAILQGVAIEGSASVNAELSESGELIAVREGPWGSLLVEVEE